MGAVMGVISLELNYWIGLTDFADDGRWIWQESHQVANWTNWQEGEPNNLGGQDCVIMNRGITIGGTMSTVTTLQFRSTPSAKENHSAHRFTSPLGATQLTWHHWKPRALFWNY